jgi:hypothetical protein
MWLKAKDNFFESWWKVCVFSAKSKAITSPPHSVTSFSNEELFVSIL